MLDQWLEKNKPEQYNHIKQMRKDNEKVTILYPEMYDQLENLYRYHTNSYYARERIKDLVLKNNLKFMREYYELIKNIDIVSENIGQEIGIRKSIVKKYLKENL